MQSSYADFNEMTACFIASSEFSSWSVCMWGRNGELKESMFWIGKQMHTHFCVRGRNSLIFLLRNSNIYPLCLYLLCFTCISPEKKIWTWLFSGFFRNWILKAALIWPSMAVVLEGEHLCAICTRAYFSLLRAVAWAPKSQVVDSNLGVLAFFVLKGVSRSRFFAL